MRDILVHARELATRTLACRFGAQLADAFGAVLTAIYASPLLPYVGPAYGPQIMGAILDEERARVAEALRARDAFTQWARGQGVRRAQWLVVEGQAVDGLVAASTRHDLLVLDRPEDTTVAAWDMPGLILRSACPCLVLPRRDVDYEAAGRAAIGWNGSPEAMRAVHAALPFLYGRDVLLVRGEERERYPALKWHPEFDIVAYLVAHGVKVSTEELKAPKDSAGTALLDAAAGFGAGLLVMGAYGRGRFSEWLLGGATRDALMWARIPVFLQH